MHAAAALWSGERCRKCARPTGRQTHPCTLADRRRTLREFSDTKYRSNGGEPAFLVWMRLIACERQQSLETTGT
ncbi:hypothetical protein ASZ90_010785 [hydrocarbon metagenome]|uniref:Uncharacterized protein n=1 Tax=hydrocarbon metagenome TaxID=938273 RepID=A0A0W8FF09_9ZZZZ|nr:hypothetical protein [Methanomicrobiaceae archaeon]